MANRYHALMAKRRDPNCSMVDVVKPGMYRGAVDDGQMYEPLKRFDNFGQSIFFSFRAAQFRLTIPTKGWQGHWKEKAKRSARG